MYVINSGDKFVFFGDYVVNISIFSPFYNEMRKMTRRFGADFEIQSSDKTEKFFRINVDDNGSEEKLSNAPMVKMLLKYFKMNLCKPALTSLEPGVDLSTSLQNISSAATPYRQMVGVLMPLAKTVRSQIAYATH